MLRRRSWSGIVLCALIALSASTLAATPALAQNDPPGLTRSGPGLFRLEGTDEYSGTEYLRLFLLAASAGERAEGAGPENNPTFTIACTEWNHRRALLFYVNFGGVEDIRFTSPFRPTRESPFPAPNPSYVLKMSFEGYIRSKQFKRAWEQVPSGNYRYRNPGADSPNLDQARYFLQYLAVLPTLHIVHTQSRRQGDRRSWCFTQKRCCRR